jgi:small conductance mechanosensitive channel
MEQFQQYLDSGWAVLIANYKPVLAAIIILVIGRVVAGWARRLTRKGLQRGEVDATLVPFLAKLVYWGVMAVVVIAALNRLGVATTSVVAIFGAAGIAVGLALKDTLANFASGVMLLVFRPFDVGEVVEIGGTVGKVQEIGIFATTINTGDNVKITMPNSQVYGGKISNYSDNETRRVDLVMGVGYDDNIQTAIDTIRRIVTNHELVLADPEPQIAVSNLGDSAVDLVVRPWCNNADYWTVRFDLTRSLKEGLEAAGCSIPYPQRDVHMYQVAI